MDNSAQQSEPSSSLPIDDSAMRPPSRNGSRESTPHERSYAHSTAERPSPYRVRLFVLSGAWGRLSRARRVVVLSSIVIVIAQLISIIIALVDPTSALCDRPLDIFLIVYLVRSVVNLPLILYHHLRPPRSGNQDTENDNERRVEWTDRLKSLFDIFGIVWFIIGNYFIFTSGQCAQSSPTLFYTTLVWILLGYGLVVVPLFLCISVIFCLPCVLVLMRMLRLGYASGLVSGASKAEVEAIPVFRYTAADGEGGNQTSTSSQQQQQQPQKKTKKRASFFRYMLRRPNDQENSDVVYDPITITPAEDAVCSICLSEYEHGDLVCKLRCGHHYHRDCVHEWLLLNSSCPLCKRDFRKEDSVDDAV
ncbi:hypothetical protein O0I10_007492 [Lichtheimia ornata]|uniref:RING-type domain-containing protein n=1 Tax=Lichtheimia ornata TaxID=688661 RepID=A0AAD7V267_9FUNG|nr:uncharacterized protein O0I10_007492 [Lichtheimia ornata]KAJ8656895.1 hypothetical protein O0I10_007492 [Lichtheimia ornata]